MVLIHQTMKQLLAIRMNASDLAQMHARARCSTFADNTKRD